MTKYKISVLVFFFLLLVFIVSACTRNSNIKPDFVYEATNFEITCLTSKLEAPLTHQTGNSLMVMMNVENICQDRTLEVHIGGFELLVTQLDGTVLWESSGGAVRPSILPPVTEILPNEGVQHEFTWTGKNWNDKKMSIGKYKLVGLFSIVTKDSYGNIEAIEELELVN